jgi:hypothetical protein
MRDHPCTVRDRRGHRLGNSGVSAATKDPVGLGLRQPQKQDQRNPLYVLLGPTSRQAAVVRWTDSANRETAMNSATWRHHWLQHEPRTTLYQLTDRLHDGHTTRVPAHQIRATVSAWLAELGA